MGTYKAKPDAKERKAYLWLRCDRCSHPFTFHAIAMNTPCRGTGCRDKDTGLRCDGFRAPADAPEIPESMRKEVEERSQAAIDVLPNDNIWL